MAKNRSYQLIRNLYSVMKLGTEGNKYNKIPTLRATEAILYRVIEEFSPHDERDKIRLLELLQELDGLAQEEIASDAFLSNQRIQKAYQQLRQASAEVVFEKGLQRLKEVRNEIWNELESI